MIQIVTDTMVATAQGDWCQTLRHLAGINGKRCLGWHPSPLYGRTLRAQAFQIAVHNFASAEREPPSVPAAAAPTNAMGTPRRKSLI